ncbi:EamA-like transporter family protein [Gregarina niphandrodes]|uniref:EamA-like transporter family protein n=1 Tax=Gregarina niphandrodes TaxID=110365 RepID=A0A023B466_GRENI|nr:EamA-like transporter family protein [Gregarina niphandrodes]EZG56397.1 EamA-like transporter family protein [Gregarina niphandrodes]|eukprot:XP_011131270.1 EamA-like transporter family protein [Gregarina niphandrodes]
MNYSKAIDWASPIVLEAWSRARSWQDRAVPVVLYGLSSATFLLLNKYILRLYPKGLVVLAVQQTLVLVVYVGLAQNRGFREDFMDPSVQDPSVQALSVKMRSVHQGDTDKTAAGAVGERPITPRCGQGAASVADVAKRNAAKLSTAKVNTARFPFRVSLLVDAFPISMAFLGMIWANVICISSSSVGSYMVAKASSLLFNLGLSVLCLPNYRTNPLSVLGCFVISASIGISAPGLQCDRVGLFAGLASSLSQAVFMLMSARLVQKQTGYTPITLMGHYTLITTGALWLAISFKAAASDSQRTSPPVILLLVSGVLNAVVAISAVCALKKTGPVTLNVMGYVKSSFQIVCARVCLGEMMTQKELLGVITTLAGSTLYSYGVAQHQKKSSKAHD